MKKTLAALVTATVLLIACGGGGNSETEPGEAPSTLTGVITEVESSGLTEVEGFTLSVEGETYEILLDPNVNMGFPPAHLNEHKTTGDPVKVDLAERSGKLYAVAIADA